MKAIAQDYPTKFFSLVQSLLNTLSNLEHRKERIPLTMYVP